MLQNLNQLFNELQNRIAQVSDSECEFTEEFKTYLRNSFHDYSIEFNTYTTVFTDDENRKQYCPNQLVRLLPYGRIYYEAIMEYKEAFDEITRNLFQNKKEKTRVIIGLKDNTITDIPENFKEAIDTNFADQVENQYFQLFLTNYNWWKGNKTIERSDFYNSPILNLYNVIHVDNGFLVKLTKGLSNLLNDFEIENFEDNFINIDEELNIDTDDEGPNHETLTEATIGYNKIFCGAPGTGKSYYVDELVETHQYVKRVVFHSEYTNQDFIGCYRPAPVYREISNEVHILNSDGTPFVKGEPLIDYSFIAGPFTEVLLHALKNPRTINTLVIEELNRANAAAVFGELFQLLDRNSDGTSKYRITNNEVSNYLKDNGVEVNGQIYIPNNMIILATLNAADQGVFPLDTAFKRRWKYEYMPISFNGAPHKHVELLYATHKYSLETFISTINSFLSSSLKVNEDKLVGPYYLSVDEMLNPNLDESKSLDEYLQEIVANKLLLYLWEDVARHKHTSLFANPSTFSQLVSDYKAGLKIFNFDFPIANGQIENE